MVSRLELRKLQEEDESIGLVLSWRELDQRPFGAAICSASPEVRHFTGICGDYWR